jgi:hypothetical protein
MAGATCGGASFTPTTKVLLANGESVPVSQLRTGMTDTNRLTAVIGDISKILTEYGHVDFARRLDGQALILKDPASSPGAITEVRERLHRAVNGMGGLNDLWLSASTHSESVNIRERLDELASELYELTR